MKTYSNGTYSVTINSDRSIKVKPGDWISKYSAAIHNDPRAHWGDYKRKVNGKFVSIANPSALNVNETIYYIGELPGWTGSPPPTGTCPMPSPTPPGTCPQPGGTGEPSPDRVVQFINWYLRVLNPVSDWGVVGSNDIGGSVPSISAQACQVGLKHVDENAARWFSGLSAGLGAKAGATFSSTWLSNAAAPVIGGATGTSFVAKGPMAGAELSPREFVGNFLRLDIGAAFLGGVAGSVLAVGCKAPPEFMLRKALEMMGAHGEFSWMPFSPMALIVLSGVNVGFDVGASIKVGQMWETSSWTGNYF